MSFENLNVELLPARTVMSTGAFGGAGGVGGLGGDGGVAVSVNAGNINFGGTQTNAAFADASGGNGGNADGGGAAAAGRDQMFG